MTREQSIRLAAVLLVVGLLIATLILGGCGAPPPTPTEEVVEETPTAVVETVQDLAEKIRAGEIDVGEEYGLGVDQRYHKIHTSVLALECTNCHAEEFGPLEASLYQQDVSPSAPGPVDRTSCLECHQEGPATDLY
ncbi:MAG: hypothetical protein ACE5NP_10115 [Anaerolineae bacterium]